MTLEQFTTAVMSQLPKIEDARDFELIQKFGCGDCFRLNFSVSDAIRYLSYTEEVNPNLSEDYAITMMNRIMAKYKKD